MPGAPSSGTTRESHAKFSDGTLWGLKKDPVDTGHRWSVFGEHSIHRETHGIRLGVDLWLNVGLTPGGTESELGLLFPPLPHEVSMFGENSFY